MFGTDTVAYSCAILFYVSLNQHFFNSPFIMRAQITWPCIMEVCSTSHILGMQHPPPSTVMLGLPVLLESPKILLSLLIESWSSKYSEPPIRDSSKSGNNPQDLISIRLLFNLLNPSNTSSDCPTCLRKTTCPSVCCFV